MTDEVTTYWLEMRSHMQGDVKPPRDGLMVLHAQRPSTPYYRFLYDAVGGQYNWFSRKRLSDEQLAAILSDPLDEVHVLHVDGAPAGFAELDWRQPSEVELVQFGLMPDFIGQGLGKWFLKWTIDHVWRRGPNRFWLHTCTHDHPRALQTYTAAGFTVFQQQTAGSH